jgi:hypothetical protein
MISPTHPPLASGCRRTVLHLPLLSALTAIAAFAAGCDRAPRQPPPIAITTPEGKLDLIMDRVESAFAEVEQSDSLGVVSQRRFDYEIIPPQDEAEPYRAKVTIESTAALSRKQAQKLALQKAAEAAKEETDEKKAPPAPSTATLVRASETRSTETVELVYRGERWELVTPPAGEPERIAFDYALGQPGQ